MAAFMISVLGSVIFWIGYFIVGFFISSLLVRYYAPHTFKWITTKEIHRRGEKPVYIVTCGIFFILWPIILLILIFYFIITKIGWNIFCSGVKKAVSIVPEFEIKKREEEN